MTSARPTASERIRAAATTLFAQRGYAGTTVRAIATLAQVDPALVIRHGGSKELLFIDTMTAESAGLADASDLFGGPIESLGARIAEYVMSSDDRVRGVFVALQQAGGSGGIGPRLRALHDEGVVRPLLQRMHGDDAELRARLVAAMMGGLMYSLWTVGDERLAAADPPAVAAAYGAAMQRLITP